MSEGALWDLTAMRRAMGAAPADGQPVSLPATVSGLSIDSRSLSPGEAFFAIRGDHRDGHDFVAGALAAGAGLAVVAESRRGDMPADAPLLVVPDVLEALTALARAARARTAARVVGVTGSVGKTGTKEALRLILGRQGPTHASEASYNNHWGVPLSVARMPAETRFGVFEMGMNHAGEIEPLTRLVRPHVAIVVSVAPAHLAHFASLEAIADAKAEIFLGLEPDGAAVINRDNPYYERLAQRARAAGAARIVSFGEHAQADARVIKAAIKPDCSTVQARILDHELTYKIGAPGLHVVCNSLAVLAAASLVGADLALAALAFVDLRPPTGRGARIKLHVMGDEAILIDESYNANPASMRAGLALLGHMPVKALGRRIAVLGDMLELGERAEEWHRGLANAVLDNGVDLVFCCGPLMKHLWDSLPSERRGGYAGTAAELQSQIVTNIRGGDAVMVKGSLGSRMGPIVRALVRDYAGNEIAQPSTEV